jgi:hypothetical protein
MYPNDVYFEIARQRLQELREQAANERLLRQATQRESSAPARPRHAAYRRLAIAILGLDISTLTRQLASGGAQPSFDKSAVRTSRGSLWRR